MSTSIGAQHRGDLLAQEVSKRAGGLAATTAALSALPAYLLANGQMWVTGSAGAYRVWVYELSSTTTVSDSVLTANGGRFFETTAGTGVEDTTGSRPRAVRAASTAAIANYTRTANVITADANGALSAQDGVTLVAGNRYLLKNGAAGADNGLYDVTQVGTGSLPFILTRCDDSNESAEMPPGLLVYVSEGTLNGDEFFFLSTNAAITLNTTSLTFTQLPDLGDLASTSNAQGASLIGIEDAATQITATTVEGALTEIVDASQLLAGVTGADGGNLIGFDDSGNKTTAATVADALDELYVNYDTLVATGVAVATKAIGFADCTDADTQQDFAFAAALPAGAVIVGSGVNVTAIFDNAGDTASLTFDLGIDAGDTDAFVDGGSLDAVAKVSTPTGVQPVGLVGAVTPSVRIDSSVNLNTITKGALVAYVLYVEAF